MNERMIYSIVENGSDAAALGDLIETLLVGGVLIFVTLRLRRAKKRGRLLVSRSARTAKLWNFLADRASLVVAVICCLAFALTIVVWNRYRADRDAIESRHYQTIVGTLSGYRVASVTRSQHSKGLSDQIPGLDPTFLHEQDAIVVNGLTFYVDCDQPLEEPLPSVGNEGRCLGLRPGQVVRIDFVRTPSTTYRAEPLRIAVIE